MLNGRMAPIPKHTQFLRTIITIHRPQNADSIIAGLVTVSLTSANACGTLTSRHFGQSVDVH